LFEFISVDVEENDSVELAKSAELDGDLAVLGTFPRGELTSGPSTNPRLSPGEDVELGIGEGD